MSDLEEAEALRRHTLGVAAFVIPTLVIGFGWKFWLFRGQYEALEMYRAHIFMPFALASLFIQAGFWAYVCSQWLAPLRFWPRTVRLFALAFPLGWSFDVCVVGAKHVMRSVSDFALLETGFTVAMYTIVCPLMSAAYSYRRDPMRANSGVSSARSSK